MTELFLPLQQIQMEMTNQVTHWVLFSKQTCHFAHDFPCVNVSLYSTFLVREQMILKEREVGYQALAYKNRILCR